MFCNQKLSMKYIKFFTSPWLLRGLWIKSFGWAIIFDVNCHVHQFDPKLQVEFLCTNHVLNTFHDGLIGSFCNSIVVVCIKHLFVIKFHIHAKNLSRFLDTNSPLLLDCKVLFMLILYQSLVCVEFVKHLSLRFQNVDVSFFLEKSSMKVIKFHAPP
jgi:hypothetical protein